MRRVSLIVLLWSVACTETYDNHDLRQFGDAPSLTSDATLPDDAGADAVAAVDAGAAPEAAPAAVVETFVSDLTYAVVSNGFGPAEKDKSNGEDAAGDGNVITLGGVTYAKGLGVHAASAIDVALGGKYTQFVADVGVDDEVMDNGSVVFRVLADGTEIYTSGTMTGASPAKQVSVDVTGKTTLRLVVEDNGDGIAADHADWAGARLRQ